MRSSSTTAGDRPVTRKAVQMISEDGAGPSPEEVVSRMIAGASRRRTAVELAEVEAWLASLSRDDLETACIGEASDVELLGMPEVVRVFLLDAFEVDVREAWE